MAEVACRCHRPTDPPIGRHWWPQRDPEPGAEVRAVALHGDDLGVLRQVRVPGGWHTQGVAASHAERTPPQLWAQVGRCWEGTAHPVVDVTAWIGQSAEKLAAGDSPAQR